MKEHEWISVKDRFPEPHIPVLASLIPIRVDFKTYSPDLVLAKVHLGKWYSLDNATEYRVTHWQQLPEPPPKPDAFDEWCGNVDWGQRNIAWIEDENGKNGCAITRTVARKVFEAGAASEREKTR